jgi:hypothetical protein
VVFSQPWCFAGGWSVGFCFCESKVKAIGCRHRRTSDNHPRQNGWTLNTPPTNRCRQRGMALSVPLRGSSRTVVQPQMDTDEHRLATAHAESLRNAVAFGFQVRIGLPSLTSFASVGLPVGKTKKPSLNRSGLGNGSFEQKRAPKVRGASGSSNEENQPGEQGPKANGGRHERSLSIRIYNLALLT